MSALVPLCVPGDREKLHQAENHGRGTQHRPRGPFVLWARRVAGAADGNPQARATITARAARRATQATGLGRWSVRRFAQLNVARARAAFDDAVMSEFMAWLADVNALAERSQGFVWRLAGASGNSTDLGIGDDPLVIVNLTVWDTIEDLYAFTYRSDHKDVFARRFEWFEAVGWSERRDVVAASPR